MKPRPQTIREIERLSDPMLYEFPVALEPRHAVGIPYPYNRRAQTTRHVRWFISAQDKLTLPQTLLWLEQLYLVREPISVEVISLNEEVTLQVVTHERDMDIVRDSIISCWPQCVLEPHDDLIYSHYSMLRDRQGRVEFNFLDYYATPPFYFPLSVFTKRTDDPLDRLYAILSELAPDELGFYQVMMIPCRQSWGAFAQQCLRQEERHAKERLEAGDERNATDAVAIKLGWEKLKESSDFYAVAVRVGLFASLERWREMGKRFVSCLTTFQNNWRAIKPLIRRHYNEQGIDRKDQLYLLFNRIAYHPGMLLNRTELAGFCHPPLADTLEKGYNLPVIIKSVRAPEHVLTDEGITLGTNEYRREVNMVRLSDEWRMRHHYVVGTTRIGKSTFLANCIRQDIEAGKGVGVVDLHGDLIDDLLPLIPYKRVGDVVLLDAKDKQSSVSINMLHAAIDDIDTVVSDLLSVMQKLFAGSWGPRLEHILRYTLYTLVLAGNSSFPDIRRILTNEPFRHRTTARITDKEIQSFWTDEFPRLPDNAIDPIINKLSKFLLNRTVRRMLCQRGQGVDLFEVMEQRKIFLAALGGVGEDTSEFLGTILVSQFQLAALRRAQQDRRFRKPFFLYADEFQRMRTASFDTILSGAGKYMLSITLAHQETNQLSNDLQRAIFGNVGSMTLFRVGVKDAQLLAPEIGQFESTDLLNLSRGETITRVGKAEHSFNMNTLLPPQLPAKHYAPQIIKRSRQYVVEETAIEIDDEMQKTPVTTPVKQEPESKKGGQDKSFDIEFDEI